MESASVNKNLSFDSLVLNYEDDILGDSEIPDALEQSQPAFFESQQEENATGKNSCRIMNFYFTIRLFIIFKLIYLLHLL